MAGLRRDLGFVELSALAASMMLGTGIFFGPSLTAQQFPDAGLVLLLWGAGGVIGLAGGWTFGRLGSWFPLSGGPYVYMKEAFGPLAAFMFAWTSFIVIAPTSMAVMANVFARHLGQLSPLGSTGVILVSLWALAAAAFPNMIGVKAGGRAQSGLTGLKIVLTGIIIGVLFFGGRAQPAEPVEGVGGLGLAFVGILFAVGGWEYSVLASEEVRDPRRTIPRAVFGGTAIVVLLYVLVVAAYLAALGADGVARSTALAPDAAEAALPGSARFVALAVSISAFGTLNAVMLLGPRATFALARDGLFPPQAAYVSKRWGTPTVSILLQAVLAGIFLVTGTFAQVAAYTVVGTGIFIAASAFAMPRLRRLAKEPRTRWTWIEDATAFVVAIAFTWFLVNIWFDDLTTALIGYGLVASGFVAYLVVRLLERRRGSQSTL